MEYMEVARPPKLGRSIGTSTDAKDLILEEVVVTKPNDSRKELARAWVFHDGGNLISTFRKWKQSV